MPKTIYLTGSGNGYLATRVGVDITWTESTQTLSIGGWYDGRVEIDSNQLTLSEFFKQLGITEKDIRKALRNESIV